LSRLLRDVGVTVGSSGVQTTERKPLDKFGLVVLVKDVDALQSNAQWLTSGLRWSGIEYQLSSEGVVPNARVDYLALGVGPKPE